MRQLLIIFFLIKISSVVYGQDNTDYLQWNSNHRLIVEDFGIKKSNSPSGFSHASFIISHSVTGFDFMTKNFNKKVKTQMIKSASWIDTTQNIEISLKYQQTLFDIAEIYVRIFRKELKENRKQIAKGLTIVENINSKIASDFATRQLQYESETNYSRNIEKQLIWEQQINQELNDLLEYDYNY